MILNIVDKFKLLVIGACLSYASTLSAAPVDELKAAYILNFAKLTDWPIETFSSDTDPIVFCGAPADPVMDALRALGEKNINGRPARVKTLRNPTENAGCHVQFIGVKSEKWLAGERSARKRGVLLIGDADGFVDAGGIIGYFLLDGKLRFEINTENARASELVLSARLLKLARVREDAKR